MQGASSHVSATERHDMRACNCARASPFQSRTCEGCDRCHPVCCRLCDEVSIHAPAWGATYPDMRAPWHRASFNPRTRVGCDKTEVSIHGSYQRFNPRTRVGCDQATQRERAEREEFQSTHPRGVRRRLPRAAIPEKMFQSTHPRGVRREPHVARLGVHNVSIHAPAWGAT